MDYRVIILLVLEGVFALWLLWRSGCVNSFRNLLRCALLIALALFIRLTYFNRENTDYQWFLKVWVDYYRTHGGFSGLRESIGNYNIPYLYFLALFSFSSIRDLYLIKLLSIFFDIIYDNPKIFISFLTLSLPLQVSCLSAGVAAVICVQLSASSLFCFFPPFF